MKYTLALLGLAASISAQGGPPSGCVTSYDGLFAISTAENPTRRDLSKRQSGGGSEVTLQLKGGVLTDPTTGDTGYVASNYQFQFDNPPQAGAIYTSGFSVCANKTLALGDSAADWYQCTNGSGDRNLYYMDTTGLNCKSIFIVIVPTGQSASTVASTPAPNSIPASSAPNSVTSGSAPASTPASTPASSPVASSSPAPAPAPAPVPSAGTGTAVVPSSTPPSTPVPAPPSSADKTVPQIFALALGLVGAALL